MAAERWLGEKAPRRSCYVLAGTDAVAVRDLKSGLIAKFGGEDPLGLSRTELDASELSPAHLVDLLGELPLFASCRVIVIRSAEALCDEKKYPGLIEAVERLDELTLLILIMDGPAKKLAESALVKERLAATAAAFFYAPRDDAEAERWVAEYAARRKYRMDRAAARKIVELVGVDPVELAPEIEKVAFASDGTIDGAAVAEYLASHREHPVFDWADAVMRGSRKAVGLTAAATDYGKDGVAAVAALAARIADLDKLERGEFLGYLPKAFAQETVRSWSASRRKSARMLLLDLDLALKSAPAEQHLARLEQAALRLIDAA